MIVAAAGGGSRVEVPFDVRAEFGEARPPVVGSVGGVEYRSRLMVYGGRSYLGLTKALRSQAGVEVGDTVEVELRRDDAPREVAVPAELEAALAAAPQARARFDELSFTHRREYAQWIDQATRDETRARRASKAVERLLEETR